MRKRGLCIGLCTAFSASVLLICNAENQQFDFGAFKQDLADAVTARSEYVWDSALSDEENAVEMAKLEWNELRNDYEIIKDEISEKSFEEKNNEDYILVCYMEGLDRQAELEIGNTSKTDFLNDWNEGFKERAYVIKELAEEYQVSFPEKVIVDVTKVTGEYSEQSTVEIYQLQALLDIKMDGDAGKGTRLALKKKQEEFGINPISGIINLDRVKEIVDKLIQNGQEDVINAANEKLSAMSLEEILYGNHSDNEYSDEEYDVDYPAEESFIQEDETAESETIAATPETEPNIGVGVQ